MYVLIRILVQEIRLFFKYSFDQTEQVSPGTIAKAASGVSTVGPYVGTGGNGTRTLIRTQSGTLDIRVCFLDQRCWRQSHSGALASSGIAAGLPLRRCDEAYLEYTSDAEARSAVSLVQEGKSVFVFETFDKSRRPAGLPIGYTVGPAKIVSALHRGGLGEAESLGRLNIATASALLADRQHVTSVRDAVARREVKWLKVLDDLKLPHTKAEASFIFSIQNIRRAYAAKSKASRLRQLLLRMRRGHASPLDYRQRNRREQEALRDAFVRGSKAKVVRS